VPDPLQGTSLYALAEPITTNTKELELLQHAGKNLPSFKLPRKIFLTRSLPKRPSGKVDRTACRKMVIQLSNEIANSNNAEFR
jgi:acyl-coenzyme A synthetase/AMP-(fatty) acid ligase